MYLNTEFTLLSSVKPRNAGWLCSSNVYW